MKFWINRKRVRTGDPIVSFRGECWIYLRVAEDAAPGKSGKILVADPRAEAGEPFSRREFYPTVFNGVIK